MSTALVWLRKDLRIQDNPALYTAHHKHSRVIPLYIHDPDYPMVGAAQKWWLHHSLRTLAPLLKENGLSLTLYQGQTLDILLRCIQQHDVRSIYWNAAIEPMMQKRDDRIQIILQDHGVSVQIFLAHLLCDPETLRNASGGIFKIFTPFWKACLKTIKVPEVQNILLHNSPPDHAAREFLPHCHVQEISSQKNSEHHSVMGDNLDDWQLLPKNPNWAIEFSKHWTPGVLGAEKKCHDFVQHAVASYAHNRDYPGILGTSLLSPHLHFGEISPWYVWRHVITHRNRSNGNMDSGNAEKKTNDGSEQWYNGIKKSNFRKDPVGKKTFEKETDEIECSSAGLFSLHSKQDGSVSSFMHTNKPNHSASSCKEDDIASCMAINMDNGIDVFLSQLGWREFSYYTLFHFPDLPHHNFKTDRSEFPWRNDPNAWNAWTKGQTGFPIVDAGMRQLWHTGTMHNRVRMIVASFLTKNLMMDWRLGAQWFMDTLLDADCANNYASWQWVAGCGADAAPYFRIFNPILQGQKFDPDGIYIKRWVPELANIPASCIHDPAKIQGSLFRTSYPHPILDLKETRLRALQMYKNLMDMT